MKTSKKILSLLLSLMLVLSTAAAGGISASALDGNSYLRIGDITVMENGELKVAIGEGWSFEEEEIGGTLSLDNFEMTYDGTCIAARGLDLRITGSAELTSTSDVYPAVSVSEGNLILDGNFIIRAQSATDSAVSVSAYLTVEGGSTEAVSSAFTAIIVKNEMWVTGGSVHAKNESGEHKAVSAGEIILKNGEEIMAGDGNSSEIIIEPVVEISNYSELKSFTSRVNGGETYLRARLINDIDASASKSANDWTPIGSDFYHPYTGIFDGCNYVITGLCFSGSSLNDVGLFSSVGKGGIIKNVFLKGGNTSGNDNVGGVVGFNTGTVTNCGNTGEVSGNGSVGGVVGKNSGTITNCGNTGTVSGRYYVGGVAGVNTSTITSCYNTGNVRSDDASGGVAGLNIKGKITNCYNTGNIELKGKTVKGGGVVGYNAGGEVTICYNTGDIALTNGSVDSFETYVGGVVGRNDHDGSVRNCYNAGCIKRFTGEHAGGVAGYAENDRLIEYCYYDSDRVSDWRADYIHAIGDYTDVLSTLTGLTTAQMTGTGALENMIFDENLIEYDNPWLMKENDDSFLYYPHLVGFNKDSQGNQLAAENIATEDWPARVPNGGTDDVEKTTVKAVDCESEITTGYKESKQFVFEIENMPEGAAAHVYYNGEDRGEGTSIEVGEPTEDYTVECKVLDADGNEIATSGEIKVTVKNGFFDKIKWFFSNLWASILKALSALRFMPALFTI